MTIEQINHIPPIPFSEELLAAAHRLKQLKLSWRPHVGCFVWDRDSVITTPSPFPHRVYFILNLKRFLSIFGSLEIMRDKLVWIPTWFQADQLCRQLGIDPSGHRGDQGRHPKTGDDALLQLYGRIATKLEAFYQMQVSPKIGQDTSDLKRWVSGVIREEVGDLDALPLQVRQRIESIYREAGRAYIGWRRIQDGQPDNWYPPEARFDDRLLNDLAHFFSDHQSAVRSVSTARTIVNRLQSIDRSTNPDAYQSLIDQLLQDQPARSKSGEILADLMQQS
ncbi:MAG: hypothetical protein PVH26_12075 [Desulfosarcina sp.]|jgi:hypothetical protein